MARVTGIGGIFLRSKDPKKLTAWYVEHLGVKVNAWGGVAFEWKDEVPAGTGQTAWTIFAEDSDHFPQSQATMINYRVDDLDALLTELASKGVEIDPKRDSADYGKFGWIKDCDGNRVELWQPL